MHRAKAGRDRWGVLILLIPMIQLRSRCSSSHLCELTRAMFSLCYHLDRALCSMTHASTSFTEFKVSLQVKVPMCVECLFEWFCFCFILFLHWYYLHSYILALAPPVIVAKISNIDALSPRNLLSRYIKAVSLSLILAQSTVSFAKKNHWPNWQTNCRPEDETAADAKMIPKIRDFLMQLKIEVRVSQCSQNSCRTRYR